MKVRNLIERFLGGNMDSNVLVSVDNTLDHIADFDTAYVENKDTFIIQFEEDRKNDKKVKQFSNHTKKPFKFEKNNWYICTKSVIFDRREYYTAGKLYKSPEDNKLNANSSETLLDAWKWLLPSDIENYFRLAEIDEIIEYSMKDGVRSCYNCRCGSFYHNEKNYCKISCWLNKDCNGDDPYVILEDEFLDKAEDCGNYEYDAV